MACSESCRSCLKFTIAFINLPFILIGAAILGLGVWIIVDDQSFFEQSATVLDLDVLGKDILSQCSIAMVATGAAMVILAGIGCIGALALCSWLLVFYTLSLIVLLAVEVAILVLAIVFRSELAAKADDVLEKTFLRDYGNNTKFTDAFNTLQTELECCGWTGYQDYSRLDSSIWNRTLENGTRVVPDSCCNYINGTSVEACVTMPTKSDDFFVMDCRDAVQEKLDKYAWIVLGVTAGVLLFQFLVITLTLGLVVNNVSNKYDMA